VGWLRVAWFAGEQVDAVAGGQGDAGVGVAEGVVSRMVPAGAKAGCARLTQSRTPPNGYFMEPPLGRYA